MKTDKQLAQEIIEKIHAQAPRMKKRKTGTKIAVVSLCVGLLLSPAVLFLHGEKSPKSSPKPNTEYSAPADEKEEKPNEN